MMTKKEVAAAKRFAQEAAKDHGVKLSMTKIEVMEAGLMEGNKAQYVLFTYMGKEGKREYKATSKGEGAHKYSLAEIPQAGEGDRTSPATADAGNGTPQIVNEYRQSGYTGDFWSWIVEAAGESFLAKNREKLFKEVTAYIPDLKLPDADFPGGITPIEREIDICQKEIASATNYILRQLHSVANSFCAVGCKLLAVKENRWYEALGYKNIYDYGFKVLGFKRSSTASYMAVCERFGIRDAEGKLTGQVLSDFADYTYSQLLEMASLPETKLGDITPEMTVREIKALKRATAGQAVEEAGDKEGQEPQRAPQPAQEAGGIGEERGRAKEEKGTLDMPASATFLQFGLCDMDIAARFLLLHAGNKIRIVAEGGC